MNKEQINKTFFEDLYDIQMNKINSNITENARKVILNLMVHVQNNNRDNIPGKDEAVLEALRWLKNNRNNEDVSRKER